MGKSVEYLLLTATVGAVVMVAGSLSWPVATKLAAVFAQLAHVLHVTP